MTIWIDAGPALHQGEYVGKEQDFTVQDLADVGRLLEEHRPRLLEMVRRRIDAALAARIDPEEILQEAFLLAARKWGSFRRQDSLTPYAWLYRIVLDCLIEAYRRESRTIRDHRRDLPWPEYSSVQLAWNLVDSATGPKTALAREELQQHVNRIVEGLGQNDQEILWMRHYDQLSFREAARGFGRDRECRHGALRSGSASAEGQMARTGERK